LLRVINYPSRGIGETTVSKLEGLSAAKAKRIWDIIADKEILNANFNKGTAGKLTGFYNLIEGFRKNLENLEAFDLAFIIADSTGILKELHFDKSPENISKYENIQELLNGIREFTETQTEGEKTTLDAYLQNVVLLTDLDTDKGDDRDKVTIMTAHSAKGLEFYHVFITGLEEDLFPSRLSSSTREELEEERRLFYVAITRAMKKVILSYAESRYKWGVPLRCTPSRFLNEIESDFVEQTDTSHTGFNHSNLFPGRRRIHFNLDDSRQSENKKVPMRKGIMRDHPAKDKRPSERETNINANEERFFQFDDPASIQVGMEVEHPRFGKGKVLNMEGEFPNKKATVFFHSTGQKQLLLKFARLKIVKSL